jgi:hypothetical protein
VVSGQTGIVQDTLTDEVNRAVRLSTQHERRKRIDGDTKFPLVVPGSLFRLFRCGDVHHRTCELNAVEGFFAILTKRRLKRGVFKGVVDIQAAINRFVLDHNQQPKP